MGSDFSIAMGRQSVPNTLAMVRSSNLAVMFSGFAIAV
jgi:hypothetical protein